MQNKWDPLYAYGDRSIVTQNRFSNVIKGGKKTRKLLLFSLTLSIVLFATLNSSMIAWGLTWSKHIVESHVVFSQSWDPEHAIAVSGNGTVFMAYGDNHLFVASKGPNDADWSIEVADKGINLGRYTSLELDQSGRPHISYYDQENGVLKYAVRKVDGWSCQTVPKQGNGLTGLYSSLALDSAGHPHISHFDPQKRYLLHSWHDGSQWHTEVLDSGSNELSCIAIDDQDRIHIGYYDSTPAEQITYALHNGTAWSYQTVYQSSRLVDHNVSLALSPEGLPYISYYVYSGNYYRLYVRYPGTPDWNYLTYQDGSYTRYYVNELNESTAGEAASLICDGDGVIHLIYKGKYVVYDWDNEQWIREEYDPDRSTNDLSLCIDADRKPHIVYHAGAAVRYAHKPESDWERQVIDSRTDCGAFPAISVDSEDRPHLTYLNEQGSYQEKDLRYCLKGTQGWQCRTIDSDYGTGYETVMKIDNQDRPHIACGSGTSYSGRPALKYLHHNEADWIVETVIDDTDIGYLDLALDNATPHILHADLSDNVVHAWRDKGVWHSEPLPLTYTGGRYVQLELGSDGSMHVAFYGHDSDLVYMHGNGTAWQSTIVDWQGSVGAYASLALDSWDRPHIAYTHYGNRSVKYAWFDGSSWHNEYVEYNKYGVYPSLNLDSMDRPHIVFYDNDNADLKYASFHDNDWEIEIIQGEGSVGLLKPNLAIDSQDRLHAAYKAEWDARYSLASIVGSCPGNFDGDEDVDGSDLSVFAADFGRTNCKADEDECEGDFDADGDVDGSDLAVFAADFGRTDCPKK